MNIHIYIGFLACTKVELWHLTVCIALNGEKFQSSSVSNNAQYRVIFIHYNVLKFQVPRSICF